MLAGLPDDALCARPNGQEEVWTRELDLLTDLKELLGVAASKYELKKPITVFRPKPRRASREERARAEYAAGAVNVFDVARSGKIGGTQKYAPRRGTTPANPSAALAAGSVTPRRLAAARRSIRASERG